MSHERIQSSINKTIEVNQLSVLSEKLSLLEAEKKCVFVHVSGASGSGKTTCNIILSNLLVNSIVFEMDRYLKGYEYVQQLERNRDKSKPFFGWDDIRVFDLPTIALDLNKLQEGQSISVPSFNRQKGERQEMEQFTASKFTIIDGIHALNPVVAKNADMKILVIAPFHDRLMRRVVRNHLEYGLYPVNQIIKNYIERVEPSFLLYHEKYSLSADYIVSNPANPIDEFTQFATPAYAKKRTSRKPLTQYSLFPLPASGLIHAGEQLTVLKTDENEWILTYSTENIQLINDRIDKNTLSALQKHYNFVKNE